MKGKTCSLKKGGGVKPTERKYRVVTDKVNDGVMPESEVIEFADQLCATYDFEGTAPDIKTIKQAIKYLRMDGVKVIELKADGGEISSVPFVYKKKESCGCTHKK